MNQYQNNSEVTPQSKKVFAPITFNDDQQLKVTLIADKAAALLDAFNDIKVPQGNVDGTRLVSNAKTELETAVMLATRAIGISNINQQ